MGLGGPDEAQLYFEQELLEAEAHGIGGGLVAVCSARCPGKESPNEDAAGLIPLDADSAVLVVADGVGGSPVGARASRLAVEAFWTTLGRAPREEGSARAAILDAIEAAQEAVLGLGVGAATTLAVVELQAGLVRPYHVGDSLVLVMGQRGRIKLQTVSHSPVGFALEAGVLDEREAMHHEDRHLVSNVLGASSMRIEVGSSLALAPRDTVLLASDGLFDNLLTGEIVADLCQGPLVDGVRRVAERARTRMRDERPGRPSKPDDLTCVAFRPASAQRAGGARSRSG